MGSRKEEERNEKIIRGLMKLPPNRCCINCNNLGPQYVCTNFWTFICTTCSGIHREFTHRVKSVSMSKFASQEVEALQNGGNQRAREIYLKYWDQKRQRLPINSDADKIREFIKIVYVDRRYAGGKSPNGLPRHAQDPVSEEVGTRRANSYHSYSQSPPYDFQYEMRRYGKQAPKLSWKPGSDCGRNAGKMSNFISSPPCSETMFDRFAHDGSISRRSDFSACSNGDAAIFSSELMKSPPLQFHNDNLEVDGQSQTANIFPVVVQHLKGTASSGSVASFDSNCTSWKSYNSSFVADTLSEHEHTETDQDKSFAFPRSSASCSVHGLECSMEESVSELFATSIDLFQFPSAQSQAPNGNSLPQTPRLDPLTASVDLFQPPSTLNRAPSLSSQASQISPPTSIDPLDMFRQIPDNGWATFDTQPGVSFSAASSCVPSVEPFGMVPSSIRGNFLTLHRVNPPPSSPLPPSQPPQVNDSSADDLHDNQSQDKTRPQVAACVDASPMEYSVFPMKKPESSAIHRRSSNPFDVPCESNVEASTTFLDKRSLEDAPLPVPVLPSTSLSCMVPPWFAQDPLPPYLPPQGALGCIIGQAPSSPFSRNVVQIHGPPVTSLGGNPFA